MKASKDGIQEDNSLSIIWSPRPSPALFILVMRSPSSLMPSTCSSRKWDSRKSQRWASPFSPAATWMLRRDWLTVFSSSRAASTASRAVPHSMVVGLAMSWKTTLPPLLFWYFMNFWPCSRSSSEFFLKNSENPWRAWSSLLKKELWKYQTL